MKISALELGLLRVLPLKRISVLTIVEKEHENDVTRRSENLTAKPISTHQRTKKEYERIIINGNNHKQI